MVLYLVRKCQRGLHTVLWSHIGKLMHRLAAEPCSTAGLLFPSRCPSGTILLTPYSMVWDWWGPIKKQGQCFFIGLSCSIPTIVFYFFPFLFFLSIGWYCGAGVFGLIGFIPLSLSLALPTFFNNNNNNWCLHRNEDITLLSVVIGVCTEMRTLHCKLLSLVFTPK